MLISKRHVFGLLTLVALTGTGHAQSTMRISQLAVRPVNDVSMSEQINQLIAQVAQLQTRIASDETKLQQTTQTATDAKVGMGFINSGIDHQLKTMTADYDGRMSTMSANINVMSANLASLQSAYQAHTHKYGKNVLAWKSVHIGGETVTAMSSQTEVSRTTSPPQ